MTQEQRDAVIAKHKSCKNGSSERVDGDDGDAGAADEESLDKMTKHQLQDYISSLEAENKKAKLAQAEAEKALEEIQGTSSSPSLPSSSSQYSSTGLSCSFSWEARLGSVCGSWLW